MLPIGIQLFGFCGGWFGHDAYNTKRVEAVGVDWVVAREVEGGAVHFASGEDVHNALSAFTVDPEGSKG